MELLGPDCWELQTQPRRALDLRARANQWPRDHHGVNGLLHLLALHTSCSLLITENADPDVQRDLEMMFTRWAPDADPAYRHDSEGPDDMAAHLRSVLSGSGLTLPVRDSQLLLGTWQGVYLYEHRAQGHRRSVAATFSGSLRQ